MSQSKFAPKLKYPQLAKVVRAYVDEELTLREVGARFGITAPSVLKVLRSHGVARRTPRQSQRLREARLNSVPSSRTTHDR